MAVALETIVKQLEDSGIVAPGKLENFVPPKAHPTSVEELVAQLVKENHLTKFQAAQVSAGKSKALILGAYSLLDKIGAGGMGQVFKAHHRRMERVVAIKMLPTAMMKDAAAAARFQREVVAAAKLRHPHIVAADDAAEANGVHFLVMEYVEGQDLSALVKKHGPFPVAKAVNYVLQAARGLEFAHKKGVVHRDIKPANLLLDNEGTVKILDMGLARIDSASDAEKQAELTGTGAVMGTVDYMAPEQALSTKHADARADVYSLGCTLYYLLAGRATYTGDTLMARLLAHREQPIPSLREAQADVPEQVEAVFKKMVAKQVEDRYQTMSEVIADLEKIGSGSSSSLGVPAFGNSIDSGLVTFLKDLPVQPTLRPQPTKKSISSATAAAPLLGQTANKTGTKNSAGKKPPNAKLIAAGAAGFLLVLLGVWVIFRDKDGNEVARVQVPAGGSATIVTQPPANPTASARTVAPFFPKNSTSSTATNMFTTSASPAVIPPPAGDYALKFDGVGIVEFDALLPYAIDACTIEAYARVDEYVPRATIYALSNAGGLELDRTEGKLLEVRQTHEASETTKGGHYKADSKRPVEIGRRVHVAGVCDKTEFRLYIDGKQVGKSTPSQGKIFTLVKQPPNIGSLFKGVIDEVRVSKVARYASDFTPAARHEPDADTLALYHCDEGAGGVLGDASGNNRHGRIVSAKWVKSDGSPIPTATANTGTAASMNARPQPAATPAKAFTPAPKPTPTGPQPPPAVAPFDAKTARSHQDAWAKHLGVKVETPNSVGQTMILIPPGEFLMGSTDEQVEAALKAADEIKADTTAKSRTEKAERPQHQVVITKPFLMSATEVTIGQFKKFAAATGYQTEAEKAEIAAKAAPPVVEAGQPPPKPTPTYLNPGYAVTDDSPAAVITWNDATAYCQWLSTQEKTTYRLPTEAEWEYACRAGTTTQYSFGDDYNELPKYGWHTKNAGGKSHPVGTLLPNGFGLFDMHGNLYEWCGDYFDEKWYAASTPNDPNGPSVGSARVLRGGTWYYTASHCRSAYRTNFTPSTRYNSYGFRCVSVW